MSILIISTILCITAILIITWLHTQHQLDIIVSPTNNPVSNAPKISVIVPARNEERNIARCVQAILQQDYPNFECIVIDDRSTDTTPQILSDLQTRDARLQVIQGIELPDGWAGKPHALTQGVQAATGQWFCFVDADTFLAPETLTAITHKTIETQADLFTVLTRQVMLTFWERSILPLVMTALSVGFSPRKVNDPARKDAIANGQFVFINREIYTAIGGHAAIKDSIVEDKDLAVRLKSRGYRLVLADGRQFIQTRMYTSLPEMWEGWTKNIYLGLRDDLHLAVLGIFGAVLACMAAIGLPLWLGAGLFMLHKQGIGWIPILVTVEAILVWGYLLFWRTQASHAMGIPGWYAVTTPLGAGVFAAMMLVSTWKVISGRGVTWKGRKYKK